MQKSFLYRPEKLIILLAAVWVFSGACVEFYNIAWGTGNWLGEFSPKWGLVFAFFVLFSILSIGWVGMALWAPQKLDRILHRLPILRPRLQLVRWTLAILVAILPACILQFTFWGLVLHGSYLRIVMVWVSTLLVGFFLTSEQNRTLSWPGTLTALLLIFAACVFCLPLAQVTSYPFSLGWSEGNRLWDYSIMFGRYLYDYPADKPIPVYLDVGRQFTGGLPFLIPGVTIWQERLWVALVDVIPYLLLGWLAYRLTKKEVLPWLLAGIWAFMFVEQGPIHPPLLLCAIVVALAWGSPLWLAIPMVAAAGLFAEISRFTWLFAPGMWAVMLEVGSATGHAQGLDKRTWQRAISLGLAGVFGGYVIPFYMPIVVERIKGMGITVGDIGSGVNLPSIGESASQPLLWYRLLPNATYGPGIIIGVILAVAPLVSILAYLLVTRRWVLNNWQKLALVLPLSAFLLVGLIVSAKIGGGGDLHNLDMFIIGMMFTGAIAWRSGGHQWLDSISSMPGWVRMMLVALVVIPGYWTLFLLQPISVTGDLRAIATLADIAPLNPLPDPLPETLPSESDVTEALEGIRAEVERAAPLGEILFMDQRQLLTFGYITGIPLVPEYDKKVLIDKALGEDAGYFEGFYRDLAAQRFSLIITNPLHERIKIDPAGFNEENNAWVKWVSTPVLCYYQPLYTLKKVTIQILGPRQDISGCAEKLPH